MDDANEAGWVEVQSTLRFLAGLSQKDPQAVSVDVDQQLCLEYLLWLMNDDAKRSMAVSGPLRGDGVGDVLAKIRYVRSVVPEWSGDLERDLCQLYRGYCHYVAVCSPPSGCLEYVVTRMVTYVRSISFAVFPVAEVAMLSAEFLQFCEECVAFRRMLCLRWQAGGADVACVAIMATAEDYALLGARLAGLEPFVDGVTVGSWMVFLDQEPRNREG